jgi:CRISPR/Cas system-associated protein Csm6
MYSTTQWLNEHPDDYIATLNTLYLRIRPMADDDTKDINGVWYSANADNPRFASDIAKLLKETHGDRAHLYALEKVISIESNKHEIYLWKSVIDLLDKEK